MTDLVVHFALSNLLVAGVVALAAYLVHRTGRSPGLAHLLWVLVLVKLVTPPLLTLSVGTIPWTRAAVTAQLADGSLTSASSFDGVIASVTEHGVAALTAVWLLGALVVLLVSLWRIYRFDRLLRQTSRPASAQVQRLADGLLRPLGMRSAPTIHVSSARMSPLTWWTGGRVRVVIPAALPSQIETERLRWVLAHELAHVKRRDYLVRWLEWLACVWFWWNPLVWWARRNLHEAEEASCDALVLDRLGVQPRSYAKTLLAVVEFLSGEAKQPPAVATGIDSRGTLEQRLMLIVANERIRSTPRWLVVGVVSASLMMLPLGIGATGGTAPSQDGPTSAALQEPQTASIDAALDESPAGAGAASPDVESGEFAMLSAQIPGTSLRISKVRRTTTAARRAVKKAMLVALEAGRSDDPAAKRTARKAIAQARIRLDRAVRQGVLSKAAKVELLDGLRQLFKPGSGSEIDLDEAIAAGVISPKNAVILLE